MFYDREELEKIGFKSLGDNVLISDKASIYNAKNIDIGSNVRIDDFVILSPSSEMIIGDYVHIACYASIIGKGKIIIGDFVGISGRVSIYSSSDDYTGLAMTNPMVPEKFKKVNNGDVILGKHTIIGAGSVILPNVVLEYATSVGSHSFIKINTNMFDIVAGVPAKFIKKRKNIHLN
jgi:galactoside O-acetyltransferase